MSTLNRGCFFHAREEAVTIKIAWKKTRSKPASTKYSAKKGFYGGDSAADFITFLFGPPDLPQQPIIEPSPIMPVLIYDDNLNFIGMIDDYEYLSWTRRWRKSHTFELQINRYKTNANKLQSGYFVVISRNGRYRAGRIEHREIGLNETGKLNENWRIVGKNVSNTFDHRIAMHLTNTGSGYDQQTGTAEALMRHYVDVNCINPADPNRIVPGLVLADSLNRGQNVTYRARFQSVADILEELSYVSGLGYDVSFDLDNSQFIFEVLEGRDLTQSQTVNPPVIFSPEFGNVQMIAYRYSELDVKNVVYVAGQGVAAQREVIEIADQAQAHAGFDRRELLADARDLDTTDQLEQRGRERLAEYANPLILEIDHLPGGPFTYLVDFDLGDIVHATYPEVGSVDARIVEVIERIDETGEQFYVTLGSEWPDIVSIVTREFKNNSLEVRR